MQPHHATYLVLNRFSKRVSCFLMARLNSTGLHLLVFWASIIWNREHLEPLERLHERLWRLFCSYFATRLQASAFSWSMSRLVGAGRPINGGGRQRRAGRWRSVGGAIATDARTHFRLRPFGVSATFAIKKTVMWNQWMAVFLSSGILHSKWGSSWNVGRFSRLSPSSHFELIIFPRCTWLDQVEIVLHEIFRIFWFQSHRFQWHREGTWFGLAAFF